MNEFGVTIPRIAVLAVYKHYAAHLVNPNLWLQHKLLFVTAIVFFFLRNKAFMGGRQDMTANPLSETTFEDCIYGYWLFLCTALFLRTAAWVSRHCVVFQH